MLYDKLNIDYGHASMPSMMIPTPVSMPAGRFMQPSDSNSVTTSKVNQLQGSPRSSAHKGLGYIQHDGRAATTVASQPSLHK